MRIILPKMFTGRMQFLVGGLDSFPKVEVGTSYDSESWSHCV